MPKFPGFSHSSSKIHKHRKSSKGLGPVSNSYSSQDELREPLRSKTVEAMDPKDLDDELKIFTKFLQHKYINESSSKMKHAYREPKLVKAEYVKFNALKESDPVDYESKVREYEEFKKNNPGCIGRNCTIMGGKSKKSRKSRKSKKSRKYKKYIKSK